MTSSRFVKRIPPSGGAPSFKLTLPYAFVKTQLMHLLNSHFELASSSGNDQTWPASILPRKNKDRSEYTLQGWRLWAEAHGVNAGDQVMFQLVAPRRLQIEVLSPAELAGMRVLPRTPTCARKHGSASKLYVPSRGSRTDLSNPSPFAHQANCDWGSPTQASDVTMREQPEDELDVSWLLDQPTSDTDHIVGDATMNLAGQRSEPQLSTLPSALPGALLSAGFESLHGEGLINQGGGLQQPNSSSNACPDFMSLLVQSPPPSPQSYLGAPLGSPEMPKFDSSASDLSMTALDFRQEPDLFIPSGREKFNIRAHAPLAPVHTIQSSWTAPLAMNTVKAPHYSPIKVEQAAGLGPQSADFQPPRQAVGDLLFGKTKAATRATMGVEKLLLELALDPNVKQSTKTELLQQLATLKSHLWEMLVLTENAEGMA